jgi:hypothetical protein
MRNRPSRAARMNKDSARLRLVTFGYVAKWFFVNSRKLEYQTGAILALAKSDFN